MDESTFSLLSLLFNLGIPIALLAFTYLTGRYLENRHYESIFAREKQAFPRGFLMLEHGAPSHDTFSRVFRLLDPDHFGACFQRFMARFSKTRQGVIAIDGKVARRSFDKASGKSAPHMVSAGAAISGWCRGKSPPTPSPTRSPPCPSS